MATSFDTVDWKIAETEFFLGKMREVRCELSDINFYFSAFLSAARTSTLALQQFKRVPGFEAWYRSHRDRLAADPLAKRFLDLRNDHVHGGSYPIGSGCSNKGKPLFFLGTDGIVLFPNSDAEDVVSMSERYFVLLLDVVYDCYVKLGVHIDPQQHYTKEHFDSVGRLIDDAELELFGLCCPQTVAQEYPEDQRWHYVRSRVGCCGINHIFDRYLGRTTPAPLEPEGNSAAAKPDKKSGWIHIPEGFASVEDFLSSLPKDDLTKTDADD